MSDYSKSSRKRPTGQKGRPLDNSRAPSSKSGADSAGNVRTTTTTERDVSWERRKAWPLLLGGAVALTGLSAVNYSWADPDGRLTDKAQDALSAKFPGAKVRVHGRDAIITGLPAGASVDVAHDLVRDIEGVRNVKEDLGSVAAGAPPSSAK